MPLVVTYLVVHHTWNWSKDNIRGRKITERPSLTPRSKYLDAYWRSTEPWKNRVAGLILHQEVEEIHRWNLLIKRKFNVQKPFWRSIRPYATLNRLVVNDVLNPAVFDNRNWTVLRWQLEALNCASRLHNYTPRSLTHRVMNREQKSSLRISQVRSQSMFHDSVHRTHVHWQWLGE